MGRRVVVVLINFNDKPINKAYYRNLFTGKGIFLAFLF